MHLTQRLFPVKLMPALLAGAALGGCSMAGTGDYYADHYTAQNAYAAPAYASPKAQSCHYTGCQSGYAVSHDYGQVQTPDSHAYGQAVPAYGAPAYGVPAYAPPTYGAAPGLRGPRKQAYTYGNLGVVNYEAGEELYGLSTRFGYQSASLFGAEVEGTLGLSEEDDTLVVGADTFDTTLKVKNSLAGFGVARLPLSPKFNVLSRVGYHTTDIETEFVDVVTGAETEQDFSTDGVAYGIGAEYNVTPRTSLRADYTVYDYDGPNADAISLAIARKF